MRTPTRLAAVVGSAALLTGLAAAPALADSSPVTATVSVPSTVTLSGVSPSIAFPATPAGQTATATAAESYSVTTNDSAGYSLTLAGTGTPAAFTSGSNSFEDYQNLAITETGTDPGQISMANMARLHLGQAVPVNTTSKAGTDNYGENWALTIPANQASGTYTEQFTYTAIGN